MPILRASQPADIPAIAQIYAYHVLNGTGTFEVDPPSAEDMARRREEVLARSLPYLVASDNGGVIGFAYCNWFKPRPAYRYSAEDSIYMAPHVAGRGLGSALLAELITQAERAGVRKLIAVIGDSGNHASVGVHRKAGFHEVGLIRSCGWKFDRWLDIVLMEKPLGLADRSPPPSALA